jgi:hypothetical protein
MAELTQNYRDLVEYIDDTTTGNSKTDVEDLSRRLQHARPSFIQLLKYKVMM